MQEIRGLFEVHVTVKPPQTQAQGEASKTIDEFKNLCKTLKCKPLYIELETGLTPTQMMTSSYHRGDITTVYAKCNEIAKKLEEGGFKVTRKKIEAMFSNKGVPDTKEEILKFPSTNYFEFHIKLDLTKSQSEDTSILQKLCDNHVAHLSRNAMTKKKDGGEFRFVTQRMYGIGKTLAGERFASCVDDFKKNGFVIHSSQREYAVYDSNIALDDGWIEALEH
mmetsp:Transcript_27063/g.30180  ORF Transcript_27063/g.30180 Transcript_27063/m.30180 type:complete len:222 (+) Transcript_27063:67-732(+)